MADRCCLRALALVLILAIVRSALGAEARRPNFLFVVTDDQRWDAMGCVQKEQGEKGRFPWFTTPNMDRLAREGVRFRNAFVVNALCAPSRACFLTGRYSHANGVVNNHTPFPASSVTHASLLRDAGYVTAYFGKWHHGQQKERPGFATFASYTGQGRFVDCPFLVEGRVTQTKGWVDDVTTDYAIEFMKRNKDKPFCAVVGYKSPHGPRTPPERAATRFAGETARPVPNLDVKAVYKTDDARPAARGRGREGPLNYFRTISAIDDCLGRILQALDEQGLAQNTVVVFASDNGYYLGEHQLGDKRSAYEESIRIPLLIRYPTVVPAGKTIDELVLNIDLAPTFLDYAGVATPKLMHGRSWRQLLDGTARDWRQAFFYAYFYERNFATPTTTAVRTPFAKLIKYPGHDEWTELYDLSQDLYETRNLAGNPSAETMRAAMEAQYAEQSRAIGFKIPEFADKP